MIVEFSRLAEADLEGIADFIATDDPDRAVSFTRELREQVLALGRFPGRYPEVIPGIRKLAFRSYLALYAVLDGRVAVLRVVHAARDWAALLEDAS